MAPSTAGTPQTLHEAPERLLQLHVHVQSVEMRMLQYSCHSAKEYQ